jgi:hypothetical protein
MPESSLTEEAAIPPAGHASDVNVTGIPGGMAGQSPARGMTIDTTKRAGDDPMFSARPDTRPSTELLVERDIPVLIHSGRRRSSPVGTRCTSHLAIPQDHASKLHSRKVD